MTEPAARIPAIRSRKRTDPAGRKARAEAAVESRAHDFTATYYAVYHLKSLIEEHPPIADDRTVETLERLLTGGEYGRQRQGLFLFRQAAEALTAVVRLADGDGRLARRAEDALLRVLGKTEGHAHRATAESLGALPHGIAGPEPPELKGLPPAPTVHLGDLLRRHGIDPAGLPRWIGRSAVFEIPENGRLLTVKMARRGDPPEALAREAWWMNRLRGTAGGFPVRFDLPRPAVPDPPHLARLKGFSAAGSAPGDLHPGRIALPFTVHPDYFRYPNDPKHPMAQADFTAAISRNAWLMGRLAALGIIHEAPIPLFHNRVQVDRRRDRGRYEWFRAGRLDRWLASCAYPNLGLSGLRDLEHLITLPETADPLYRHIGNHMLSLLLVIGSHFRCRAPGRVGREADGRPVDVRNLFDPKALRGMILAAFQSYHEGFCGGRFPGDPPLDLARLASRMAEEMGVDRYMEEMVRTPDQEAMSDAAFREFLADRGYDDEAIAALPKGERDLSILSGPHLGEFNRPISLPELIHAVETFSALCIAGRYRRGADESDPSDRRTG